MNLAKLFKELRSFKKTDKNLYYLVSAFFARVGDDNFRNCVELQPERILDCSDWTYYQHKQDKNKTLSCSEYRSMRDKVSEEKGKEGLSQLRADWVEIYDPKLFEKDVDMLKKVCKILNKYSLNAKVCYDKDYKKASVDELPSRLWIKVRW